MTSFEYCELDPLLPGNSFWHWVSGLNGTVAPVLPIKFEKLGFSEMVLKLVAAVPKP